MADGGNLAITGSDDSSIRIWDLKSPPVSQTTKYHHGDTLTVVVSTCGMYAVSGSQDSSIKIYDLEPMTVLKQLHGHQGAVNDVVVLRDSKHLLSGSDNGSICLWNGETEELVRTYQDDKTSCGVNCIAVSTDSELLMSGHEDGQVAFWSVKSGKLLKTFTNHKSAVVAVAFTQTATNKYILSASRDGLVCGRDFYTAKIFLSKQSTHMDDLLCLSVSRDGAMYASGSKDRSCHVVSFPTGSLISVLVGHKGPVRSVRIIQGGKLCITASEDCTLRIWDIHQSECTAKLHADLPILSCDVDRHDMNIVYGTSGGWVSTALYRDSSLSGDENPVMKRLNGITESHSLSSLTETDSSQSSSVVMSTNTKQQVDTVNMVDASSIPLPPSEDGESNYSDDSESRSSQASISTQSKANPDVSLKSPKNGTGMISKSTATIASANDKDSAVHATGESAQHGGGSQLHLQKPIPEDHDEFKISTNAILKIKSEIARDNYESVHSIHEDTDCDRNKTVPPTSSACALL